MKYYENANGMLYVIGYTKSIDQYINGLNKIMIRLQYLKIRKNKLSFNYL